MRGAWLVMKKEFLELSKDRKTLFFTFVMPLILYPAIFGMMGKMNRRDKDQRESKPSRVYLVDPSSVLASSLQADPKDFKLVGAPAADLTTALRNKDLEMAVDIPADAAASFKAGRTFTVTAHVNKAEDDSELALKRLNDLLDAQDKGWVKARLQALNASPDLVNPSTVEVKNAADEALELGKALGIIVPYIVLIGMFMPIMGHGGGMTAGERERGTLMSLLSTRIPRSQIAFGKLMALFVLGLGSTAANVVGIILGMNLIGQQAAQSGTPGAAQASAALLHVVTPGTLVLLLVLLIPVALVMVAFVLNVGIRAKSQREAATALMPGMFVIIGLGVFSLSPGLENMAVIHFVPIINASMAIREMFGQQLNTAHYLLALGINTALALVLTSMAAKTLNREDVLFKS